MAIAADAIPEVPRETRTRIIEAILHLLHSRDITHLTIDVVLRTARVSRGTFYRYFPDKTAALTAAIESAFSELRRAPRTLDGPLGNAATERRRLAQWLDEIMRHSVRSPGIQRAIQASPQLRKARLAQSELTHQAVHDAILQYVIRLRDAGLILTDNPESLTWGIVCVVNGLFKRIVLDGAPALEPLLLAGGLELISRALFGDPD